MTKRNFTEELQYSTYIDMENGNDTETIDYPALIGLLEELYVRIAELEARLNDQPNQ